MSVSTPSPIVAAAGGSFLLETRTPAEVFTPEDLNEEQRQIASTVAQFAAKRFCPTPRLSKPSSPGF
jgi:butyryl-CoA dehydrogenase